MNYADMNHGVPENIERMINDKGLKKRVVAERAGMNAQTLSDIFANRKLLKIHDLIALAGALECTPAELMRTDRTA